MTTTRSLRVARCTWLRANLGSPMSDEPTYAYLSQPPSPRLASRRYSYWLPPRHTCRRCHGPCSRAPEPPWPRLITSRAPRTSATTAVRRAPSSPLLQGAQPRRSRPPPRSPQVKPASPTKRYASPAHCAALAPHAPPLRPTTPPPYCMHFEPPSAPPCTPAARGSIQAFPHAPCSSQAQYYRRLVSEPPPPHLESVLAGSPSPPPPQPARVQTGLVPPLLAHDHAEVVSATGLPHLAAQLLLHPSRLEVPRRLHFTCS
ncbi:hypothetical protein D1007_01773 [Hordeum vulgare]|nr:hypothetical protein D1007_01773 [Hordeum vulgare]